MTIPSGNPLAYVGIKERNPPNLWVDTRDPLTTDYKSWDLGDIWLNKTAKSSFQMVAKTASSGGWALLGNDITENILTLTGNSGGAVGADALYNLNIVGSASKGINVVGTPLTNTLTVGMQSPFTGNFTFTSAVPGTPQTLTVSQTDNTAPVSDAVINVIAGTGGGEAHINFKVAGGTEYYIGSTKNATQRLHIGLGSTPDTGNTYMELYGNSIFNEKVTVINPQKISQNAVGQLNVFYQNPAQWSSGTFIYPHLELIDEKSGTASAALSLTSRTNNGGISRFALISVGANNSQGSLYIAHCTGSSSTASLVTVLALDDSGELGIRNPYTHFDTFYLDSAGVLSLPLHPCFQAKKSADSLNATGAGANFNIGCGTALYDQNSNYNTTTFSFTAPVAGKYYFESAVLLSGLTAAMTQVKLELITTGGSYLLFQGNSSTMMDVGNTLLISGSKICAMVAGNTAYVLVTVSNGAGNSATVGAMAGADVGTTFSGYLVC